MHCKYVGNSRYASLIMILLYTLLYSYIDWFVYLYRYLDISYNQLSVLPSCLYRMNRLEGLDEICTDENPFSTGDRSSNKQELKPEDFTTIRVPSLFHTVATSVVSSGYVHNNEKVLLVIHV